MSRHDVGIVRACVLTLVVLSIAHPLGAQPGSQGGIDAVLDHLAWRNIGPANMGGRIDDFGVVESDPRIIFAGLASGGVWKTINGGITWEPVFDDQPVSSIGDVAVAPSDPSIVWVGTGEPANRQSSSWGNGVYKSTDAGKTWSHMGLDDTLHIGRVVIHPRNPDVVYVAAVGHLWGSNPDRGLYKTTDGGNTWTNTLFINEDTGFIDVAIDPVSPDTLYAGAYQRRRTAFGFNGGGGGSGLYKTIDAGENWTKLAEGLPEGDTGRIGLDIYRKDPRIVYAIIQNADGGVFRSEDKGATWTRMSDTNPRPMYYSQVRIDPQNDQRIWVLGGSVSYSDDGGKNFRNDLVTRIHGDNHALWISPANSDHLLLGSDGGIHQSLDRGRTWDFINTMAIGQFYEIGYDMDEPYHIYGGLQDNGSWGAPVRTMYSRGITNEEWFRVGPGDGFYAQVDPTDPDTIYVEAQGGNLSRLDLKTTERKTIRPVADFGDEAYRFDWNSPLLISPHDSRTIYYGGNHLFISTDRGDSWAKTVDLTTNPDRDAMSIMGVTLDQETILSRNDGVSSFAEMVTITESPSRRGVLYVGADDGSLRVSRDNGDTWTDVAGNVPDLPAGTFVTRLVASHHADGRVYATFDGHRSDDYKPYVYVSEDFGESWRSLASTLPAGHTMNVIREHPRQQNLLVLGGEFGAYVSIDRGRAWHQLEGSLPTVPVDDIAIHPRENDLILGTHGRSIWVLDDMTPLEQLSDSVLNAELHLFDMRDAVSYRIYSHKGSTGHEMFVAPNPPEGALIHYWVKAEPADEAGATITILGAGGESVRTLEAPATVGLNRANWDLRYDPPIASEERGFSAPPLGPVVLPGDYRVRVSVAGRDVTKRVRVTDDPRIELSQTDRRARLDAVLRLKPLITAMDRGHESADNLTGELTSLQESFTDVEGVSEAITSEVESLLEKVGELQEQLSRSGDLWEHYVGSGFRPGLYRALEGYSEAPSADQLQEADRFASELRQLLQGLNTIIGEEVPALERRLQEQGLMRIGAGQAVEVPGQP